MKYNNVFTGKDYRITVLTDRLIRLEYDNEGLFCDDMTKAVVNRDFDLAKDPVISSSCDENSGILVIETGALLLTYDK
ncbi:MAG: hypothetical protein J6Z02_05435, partial [Lachnospiraceae bacterium]|nr:hypothetical protein [Lachnospiraceae bacterium]